jgi:two-component system cell cycle response regulator DivK
MAPVLEYAVSRATKATMSQLGRHESRSAPTPPVLPDQPGFLGSDANIRQGVVLIVDDIEDCRDMYGQFLRHSRYEVLEAADGNEALAKAAALRPDVIVMDLWMPHLDGWETIRRLKASPSTARIPILVLTGDAYGQARQDAEAAGCEAYLVKPCLPTDVAAEVGRLLAATRSGGDAPPVRVMTERRSSPSRRRSETGGGLLAAVVADVDRRFHEVTERVRAIEEQLGSLPGPGPADLRELLRGLRESRTALARHIEALKVISRTADVKITIPAGRRPPRS